MALFPGFEQLDIDTDGARIRLVHGGKGEPLLLLHGNPFTHVSWHKMAPKLAERFHIVAPDLRGYGDSTAPEAGENNINYSFRNMALDQVQVMEKLGYKKFKVAGHDRGARTTHRMCLDHPDKVLKAAIIDILPSHHVWTHASKEWATKSWHWLFMIQPAPFPETLLGSVPADWFMRNKLLKSGVGLSPFTDEALAEYIRCFNEKTIRGSCNDYRACATCDFEMDSQDFAAGNKVKVPLLVLWGDISHTQSVFGDVLSVWRHYAENVTGHALKSGHYPLEQTPEVVLDEFLRFFPG
jgi:haloacetate dehalogenase